MILPLSVGIYHRFCCPYISMILGVLHAIASLFLFLSLSHNSIVIDSKNNNFSEPRYRYRTTNSKLCKRWKDV